MYLKYKYLVAKAKKQGITMIGIPPEKARVTKIITNMFA
jgi:hypothetical protein